MKLIKQLFLNDEGIKETIDKYVLKTIAKYEEE